jgi:hypothetical protein
LGSGHVALLPPLLLLLLGGYQQLLQLLQDLRSPCGFW